MPRRLALIGIILVVGISVRGCLSLGGTESIGCQASVPSLLLSAGNSPLHADLFYWDGCGDIRRYTFENEAAAVSALNWRSGCGTAATVFEPNGGTGREVAYVLAPEGLIERGSGSSLVRFGPDCDLFSISPAGVTRLDSSRDVGPVIPQGEIATDYAISPSGDMAVATLVPDEGSAQSFIRVTGRLVQSVWAPVTSMAFPSDHSLIVSTSDGQLGRFRIGDDSIEPAARIQGEAGGRLVGAASGGDFWLLTSNRLERLDGQSLKRLESVKLPTEGVGRVFDAAFIVLPDQGVEGP